MTFTKSDTRVMPKPTPVSALTETSIFSASYARSKQDVLAYHQEARMLARRKSVSEATLPLKQQAWARKALAAASIKYQMGEQEKKQQQPTSSQKERVKQGLSELLTDIDILISPNLDRTTLFRNLVSVSIQLSDMRFFHEMPIATLLKTLGQIDPEIRVPPLRSVPTP